MCARAMTRAINVCVAVLPGLARRDALDRFDTRSALSISARADSVCRCDSLHHEHTTTRWASTRRVCSTMPRAARRRSIAKSWSRNVLRSAFEYAFVPGAASYAGGVPMIEFHRIGLDPFMLLGERIVPLRLKHTAALMSWAFGLATSLLHGHERDSTRELGADAWTRCADS